MQFEPDRSRDSRGEAVSIRAQGADGGDVGFDPPSGSSPRSPMGACASAYGSNNSSGVCRDNLLVTGKKPGEKDVPLDWNGWENDEEDVWQSDLPGQSDDELVASDFVRPADIVGGPEADQLGGTGEIGRENHLGDAPEPSTMLLMGGGLFALGFYRKKRGS